MVRRPFLQDKCSVYPLKGIWKRMRGSNEIYDKAIKSTFENIYKLLSETMRLRK